MSVSMTVKGLIWPCSWRGIHLIRRWIRGVHGAIHLRKAECLSSAFALSGTFDSNLHLTARHLVVV